MRNILLATTMLVLPISAVAQSLQSGTVGGMPYVMLPASGGCSAAAPCSVVTYLSYMDEAQSDTANDVQQYFGGSFAQQNPHTVVIAPMITQPQDSDINWGGYNTLNTPQQQQMVSVVQSVEQSMGNTVNSKDSVVTGGSLGGNGTQAALVAYGPNGTVSPGVFSAGLSFDARLDTGNTQALCGVPLMAVHGTDDTEQSIATDQGLQSSIDGNAACSNSFTFVPVQGAGHGTWGGSSGYPAGTGPGTPLAFVSAELTAGASGAATPIVAANPPLQAATSPAPQSSLGTITPQTSLATATSRQVSTAPPANSTLSTTTPEQDIALAEAEIKLAQMQAATSTPNALLQSALLDDATQRLNDAQTQLSGTAPSGASIPAAIATTQHPTSGQPSTANLSPAATGTALPTPAPAPVQASACDVASSGQFAEMGQTIFGPNQQPFVARGINIMEGQEPTAAEVMSAFPGVNFIRYAIYDYEDPTKLAAYIQQFTDKGIVVELEDHHNSDGSDAGGESGQVFTGAQLSTELAWYSAIGTAFKANPYVWFGTDNEPAVSPSVAALSDWQQQTYQAIRSSGNNSPIMLETIIGTSDMSSTNDGMVQADYSNMTNTIWDMHYYGWVTNYSTDQNTVNQSIAAGAAAAQRITNAGGVMPVLIGEYGNSTTGMTIDPNGTQVVAGVDSSGFGSAAWAWGPGNPGDGLTNGDSPSSPYGQQVASYIAGGGASGTASQAVACAAPTTTAAADSPTASASADAVVAQTSLSGIAMPASMTAGN